MADFNLDDQPGAAFRAELNTNLTALQTFSASASEPGTTAAYMLWADSGNNVVSIRDSSDAQWNSLFSDVQIIPASGSVGAPGYAFDGDENTGFFPPTAGQINIVCDGVAVALASQGIFRLTSGVMFEADPGTGPSDLGITFQGDTDTGFTNVTANTIEFVNGASNTMILNGTRLELEVLLRTGTDNVDVTNAAGYILGAAIAQNSATDGQVFTWSTGNSQWEPSTPSGSGDVIGPASSTDNALVRWDGTGGGLLQNSGILVDDSDIITVTGSDDFTVSTGTGQIVFHATGGLVITDGSDTSPPNTIAFFDSDEVTLFQDITVQNNVPIYKLNSTIGPITGVSTLGQITFVSSGDGPAGAPILANIDFVSLEAYTSTDAGTAIQFHTRPEGSSLTTAQVAQFHSAAQDDTRFTLYTDAQQWQLKINPADDFIIRDNTGTADVVTIEDGASADSLKIEADGDITIGGVFNQEAWTAPSYANSWVDFGGARTAGGYRLNSLGQVELRGSIKDGTIASAAFTLAVGYRPPTEVYLITTSNGAFGEIRILADGRVFPNIGNNTSFSLEGAFFDV